MSWINFEVREKRFTKEFRVKLAISDFDIQLTWKDPENSSGIWGNLKRQLLSWNYEHTIERSKPTFAIFVNLLFTN